MTWPTVRVILLIYFFLSFFLTTRTPKCRKGTRQDRAPPPLRPQSRIQHRSALCGNHRDHLGGKTSGLYWETWAVSGALLGEDRASLPENVLLFFPKTSGCQRPSHGHRYCQYATRGVVRGGLSPARYTLDSARHASARHSSEARAAQPQPTPSKVHGRLATDSGSVAWGAGTANILGSHMENESGCEALLEDDHHHRATPRGRLRAISEAARWRGQHIVSTSQNPPWHPDWVDSFYGNRFINT